MIPNQSLLVSITLRNKGNTTWTEPNYGLAVVEDPCNLMGTSLIPVGTGSSALPFTNYDFLVQITAPATQGPCLVRLQMTESGSNFGPILVHTITVVSPTNDAKDWTFYE
ncbi:hypothetical protein HYR69_11300 [Candidatus Sumerlaeota bacterium]|nr:hypothetical protein [Candidatus Sumerlaeota bacterium]